MRISYRDKRDHKLRIFGSGVLGSTGEARTIALYACARSVALVVAGAVPFLTGSTQWLQAVALSMIIVQACDTVIGLTIKDRMKTFGPTGIALLNLAAVNLARIADLKLLLPLERTSKQFQLELSV